MVHVDSWGTTSITSIFTSLFYGFILLLSEKLTFSATTLDGRTYGLLN